MIAIISPSKTMDMESQPPIRDFTQAAMISDAAKLVGHMQHMKPEELEELMSISEDLADLNMVRFRKWSLPFNDINAKQAIFSYRGDVYQGLDLDDYTRSDLTFAQKSLRILSGLYGILKPLDLIQAYRLEMGTQVSGKGWKNLYEFWGEKLTNALAKDLADGNHRELINLASKEYSSALDFDKIPVKTIQISFYEEKDGKRKILGLFAKRARGKMLNFIIRNKIKAAKNLKAYDVDGYTFKEELSTEKQWVFSRPQPPPVS